MSNWFNRNFRKSSAVKVILVHPDHRATVHYVIPKGDYLTVNKTTFVIDKDKMLIDEKRFPTFIYKYDDIEPYHPYTPLDAQNKPIKSPTELYAQSENKLALEFIKASTGGVDAQMILLIGLGVLLFAMVFGFYTMYNELKAVKEILGGIMNG
jgi:hypothetical protein